MEIRLKHLRPDNWSGVNRFKNCTDALGPYLTRSGNIYTGLTRDDEKRLGEALGYDLRKNSKFWETFRIRIGDGDAVFQSDDPADELKILFLKGHKRVKSSIHEMKSTANYYISDMEEEASTFNEINRLKRRAMREFDKLKIADIRKALRIMGISAQNVSDSVAEDRLFSLVERNPQHFISRWVDNQNRATEFLVKEAMSQNIINKAGNTVSYNTLTLGYSVEDAILFLDNGENSDIKAEIINMTTKK